MDRRQFYVVWCPTGGSPTVRHSSFEAARTEAERLARMNPGEEFHVLASLGTAKVRDVDWVEHNNLPF